MIIFNNYNHPGQNKDYLYPNLENSVSKYYYDKNKENRDRLKDYVAGLSYQNTSYINRTAKFSANKINYEIVIKNNIN